MKHQRKSQGQPQLGNVVPSVPPPAHPKSRPFSSWQESPRCLWGRHCGQAQLPSGRGRSCAGLVPGLTQPPGPGQLRAPAASAILIIKKEIMVAMRPAAFLLER